MVDQTSIDRRRKLAQALRQSAEMGSQGSQAGRFYVAPSPFASIMSGLASVGGGFMSGKADREQDQFDTDQKEQLAKALREMTGDGEAGSLVSKQDRPSGMGPLLKGPTNTDPTEYKIPVMMRGLQVSTPSVNSPAQQAPEVDPRQEAALSVLRGLPLEQQRAIISQQAAGRLFPKEPEPYTLAPGATRFGGNNKPIAQAPNKPSAATPFERQLESAGFVPGTPEYQEQLKKYLERQTTHAPAPATNVTLNTEKNLYGTMADAQGKENVNLFQQAQKAPELLGRAQRVKQLLSEGDAITGAGADWLLTGAKVANQFGFNTGDAAADTEALGRDLAAATLDQIKSSGLGAGSGFSNADRDFLEKVVGGTITLEASTLKRLAELNEKSALATIDRWNAAASRLDPMQLKNLGMSQIAMPQGSAAPGAQPKLVKNPDGTYTFTP